MNTDDLQAAASTPTRVNSAPDAVKPSSIGADFSHIRSIDGLRAVAILLVLLTHFGFNRVVPGGFGVTLFFFVSGLLITRLLLAELRQIGKVDIRQFYIRRILRLYPALILSIGVSCAVYAYCQGYVIVRDVLAALAYVSNYYNLSIGFGTEYPPEFTAKMHMDILWSLAVEEQYYIVFPFFFVALASRGRRLLQAMIAIAILTLVWRAVLIINGADSNRIYSCTDTRIDSILYGAILTALLVEKSGVRWLRFFEKIWVQAIAGVALLSTFLIRNEIFRDTLRYSIQGLALMPLVAVVCFSDHMAALRRFLESKPMKLMGAWSYSLYLFNQLAQTVAELLTGEPPSLGYQGLSLTWYAIALSVTFGLSLASYYGVEKPFVSLRHRFGSRTS